MGKGFDSDFGVLIEEDGDNVSGSGDGHLFCKIVLPTWYEFASARSKILF